MTNPAILVATTAAAAAAAKAREEEEGLTKYSPDDMEGWEFKIMRSTFGKFSNYQTVQQLCQEEARAGWEMVEKFDSYRIRFKRKIDHRRNDHLLQFDPYRTTMGGGGDSTKVMLVMGMFVVTIGVVLATAFLIR